MGEGSLFLQQLLRGNSLVPTGDCQPTPPPQRCAAGIVVWAATSYIAGYYSGSMFSQYSLISPVLGQRWIKARADPSLRPVVPNQVPVRAVHNIWTPTPTCVSRLCAVAPITPQ